mgnify:CR=1 FL=1
MSITETIFAVVSARPESKREYWVSHQFGLEYAPGQNGEAPYFRAMVGGSSVVSIGEDGGEFVGEGATAEDAIADLQEKMAAGKRAR